MSPNQNMMSQSYIPQPWDMATQTLSARNIATQASDRVTNEMGTQIEQSSDEHVDKKDSHGVEVLKPTKEISAQANETSARDMATQASFKICHEMGIQATQPDLRDIAT